MVTLATGSRRTSTLDWFKAVASLIVGVALAAWAVADLVVDFLRLAQAKAVTQAHMIDVGPDAEFGVYVFTVGGQRFHGRSYRFYETGQKIRILYNPRHPKKNRPEGDRVDLTYSLVIPFFLGCFSYIAIWGGLQYLRAARAPF